MFTSSPDSGRADFRVMLWLFMWLVIGSVLAWTVVNSGDFSAMFAGTGR